MNFFTRAININNNNKLLYVKYFLFFVVVYFSVFYNLNDMYIMIWDEARVACSSYEMLKSGNYFAVTYLDALDDWSTKPILLNWIQALFIKIFSFSELSVRLPSALASCILCFAMLIFFKNRLYTLSFGFIITLVLVTSSGYTHFDHSVRTADYESVLSVFMITGCLQFYIYINENKDKNLLWAMLLFAAAVLVKGPAGLFFAPSLFIYTLIKKQFIRTLKNKYFYFGLVSFILLVGTIYFLREKAHPGYLKLFNEMEFLGRQNKAIEGHEGNFWFYLNAFIDLRFKAWYTLVPIGLFIGLFVAKEKFIKNLSLYFLILFIGFFLVISTAKTKCGWYDFSLFPIISYFAALPIWYFYQFIITNNSLYQMPIYSKIFAYSFIFSTFYLPYKSACMHTIDPGEEGFQHYNTVQHYLKLKRPVIENSTIAVDGYFSPQLFYVYKHDSYHLKIQKYQKEYFSGEKVIASEQSVIGYIESAYNVDVLDTFESLKVFKIISKK